MLKPIYTAPTEDAALMALTTFADSVLGKKYPAAVASWENAWDRFTPFLAFGPALRKVIYTTNSIESLNYQLRKIIKNRGHFPSDTAAIKLLWLAIRTIEDKRARERAKEAGRPRGLPRKPPANSSKAPPSPAGPPSANSPSSTPTESTTTSKTTTYTENLTPSR
jgi:putative transposase